MTALRKFIDSRIFLDSSLFFGARLLGAASTFITHWLLARWLGAEAQGTYTDVFSWALLLSALALLGFPRAAIRFLPAYRGNDDPGAARGFVTAGLWVAAGSGSFLLLTGLLWLLLTTPYPAMAIGLMTVLPLMVINHLTGVSQGIYWRLMAALPKDSLRPTLTLVALFLLTLIYPQGDVRDALAITLLVAAVIAIAMLVTIRPRLNTLFGHGRKTYRPREWVGTGIPMMVTNLAYNLYPELNVVIIGLITSDADVGVFYIAFRLAFFIGFGLVAVDQATLPDASRRFSVNDHSGMEQRLRKAGVIKVLGAFTGLLLLMIVGKPILGLFGDGTEYIRGYTPMLWLAGILFIRALFGPVSELLAISGQQNFTVAVAMLVIAVTAALHLLLIPLLGINGAALSAFIASATGTTIMAWRIRRVTGLMPCPLLPAGHGSQIE